MHFKNSISKPYYKIFNTTNFCYVCFEHQNKNQSPIRIVENYPLSTQKKKNNQIRQVYDA